MKKIRFSEFVFHPVIDLPAKYPVLDLSVDYDPNHQFAGTFCIGRYNENRQGMYTQDLFSGRRTIHMGIDIGAPVGTEVKSFYRGQILLTGYNGAEGDYGYTIITEHILDSVPLYALWGHLSRKSIEGKFPGMKFEGGEVIAWLGDKHENGGWNPHLHFQLCWERPLKADLPGVVSSEDHEAALKLYPDPRLVLGDLY